MTSLRSSSKCDSDDHEILVTIGDSTIYNADAKLTDSGYWLNDSMIHFSSEYDRISSSGTIRWCALHPITVNLIRDYLSSGITASDLKELLCDEYTRMSNAELLLLPVVKEKDIIILVKTYMMQL